MAPKRGFIFTNYSQLINVKQNQSERIHLSNYIQVKLCGAGFQERRGMKVSRQESCAGNMFN